MTKITRRQRKAFSQFTDLELRKQFAQIGEGIGWRRRDGVLTAKACKWGSIILKELDLRKAGVPIFYTAFRLEPTGGYKTPLGFVRGEQNRWISCTKDLADVMARRGFLIRSLGPIFETFCTQEQFEAGLLFWDAKRRELAALS